MFQTKIELAPTNLCQGLYASQVPGPLVPGVPLCLVIGQLLQNHEFDRHLSRPLPHPGGINTSSGATYDWIDKRSAIPASDDASLVESTTTAAEASTSER